ncbi:MAG: [FeFe] hydrogenase H-cluster maturation GTPase HydF [Candidatus Gastranaerophilales bacterium]|nr:[FeFe] hydrogenase H-cluster maturation GTPase HydF [Candidatus Gastranaerophilales bacterium]
MQKTPKALRLHIGIFGRRNVGKSSIINKLTHQNISIVSNVAGTTTDAVEKTMEMLPLGPVVFIDTAGIDDIGELGKQRVDKTLKVIDRTDIAIIVCDKDGWDEFENELFKKFQEIKIPTIAVINKTDLKEISQEKFDYIKEKTNSIVKTSAQSDENIIIKIKQELINNVPEEFITPPSVVEGAIEDGENAILVTPIDKEAPKGRLILPEVQVLRELLDKNCQTIVVTEKSLKKALSMTKEPPKIVITDSQAFKEVNDIVPENINLTSFSILFARLKGDLKTFIEGAKTIKELQDGDKILICESCTHHQIADDIGQVKIPNFLRKKTGKNLIFEYYSSHQFAENIKDYKLIIHCGGCMTNRREILSRILKCKNANVPITNYGVTIAYCLGILDRATEMFMK